MSVSFLQRAVRGDNQDVAQAVDAHGLGDLLYGTIQGIQCDQANMYEPVYRERHRRCRRYEGSGIYEDYLLIVNKAIADGRTSVAITTRACWITSNGLRTS